MFMKFFQQLVSVALFCYLSAFVCSVELDSLNYFEFYIRVHIDFMDEKIKNYMQMIIGEC